MAPFKVLRQRYTGTRFEEQRQLHTPQKHKATVPDSTLRVEINALEEQADNAKARELFWEPLSWLCTIRPTTANDALDPALWETFVSTTLGLEVPILAALPRLHNSPLAKSGCKKFCMDFHGDHTGGEHVHSLGCNQGTRLDGVRIGAVVPKGRTRRAHTTRSDGKRRPTARDVEIRNYLRDQAGSRSLVFDLSIAHDRFGSSRHPQQNASLTHPQDIDAPLRIAAQRADTHEEDLELRVVILDTELHGCAGRCAGLEGHRLHATKRVTHTPSGHRRASAYCCAA